MRYTIKEVTDYCSRNGISVYECWDEIRVVKNWNEKENSDGGDR